MANVGRRRLLTVGLSMGAAVLPMAPTISSPVGKRRGETNRVLGQGGVHHTAVRTRDWDRTLAFYQTVLGFTVKLAWQEVAGTMEERLDAATTRPRNQRWAYLDSGDGTCIEIFEDFNFVPPVTGATDPTNTAGSPIVHLGIRTSRLDQVFARARKFGTPVSDEPTDYTLNTTSGQGPIVVRIGFIQGPSGEWIELIQGAP